MYLLEPNHKTIILKTTRTYPKKTTKILSTNLTKPIPAAKKLIKVLRYAKRVLSFAKIVLSDL